MSKVDVYVGEYLTIEETTHQESERLASNESMVGMPFTLEYDSEKKGFRVFTPSHNSVGMIYPRNKLRLLEAFENGWPTHCWLSLVYYNGDEKLFHGEVAYLFYNVKPSQTQELAALDAYAKKLGAALAAGKRPRFSLTGTQYDQVIASGGNWETDEKEPLPFSTKRGSDVVVFKNKRSVGERLAQAAIERKPGCRIVLLLAVIVVALLVVFLVWKCAFNG